MSLFQIQSVIEKVKCMLFCFFFLYLIVCIFIDIYPFMSETKLCDLPFNLQNL